MTNFSKNVKSSHHFTAILLQLKQLDNIWHASPRAHIATAPADKDGFCLEGRATIERIVQLAEIMYTHSIAL